MSLGPYALLGPPGRRLALAHPARAPRRLVVLERAVDDTAAHPSLADRLVDEALSLRADPRPGLLPLLDAFVGRSGAARPLFFVHEHAHGATLDALLAAARRRAEPVPPPVAVAIALDALAALDALHRTHRQGPAPALHRHLTPRWVIVGADGSARVGGVTEALRLRWPEPPERSLLMPLLCRLAPEQARGEPPTAATDTFAVGSLLWEMLAGQPRIEAQTPLDALQRATFDSPRPLSAVCAGLPAALDQAVAAALARRPRERPAPMALFEALGLALPPAPRSSVAAWAQALGAEPFPGPEVYSLVEHAEAPPSDSARGPAAGSPYRRGG